MGSTSKRTSASKLLIHQQLQDPYLHHRVHGGGVWIRRQTRIAQVVVDGVLVQHVSVVLLSTCFTQRFDTIRLQINTIFLIRSSTSMLIFASANNPRLALFFLLWKPLSKEASHSSQPFSPGLELGLPDALGIGLCLPVACGSSSSIPALRWKRLARFTTRWCVCVRTDTAPDMA